MKGLKLEKAKFVKNEKSENFPENSGTQERRD